MVRSARRKAFEVFNEPYEEERERKRKLMAVLKIQRQGRIFLDRLRDK